MSICTIVHTTSSSDGGTVFRRKWSVSYRQVTSPLAEDVQAQHCTHQRLKANDGHHAPDHPLPFVSNTLPFQFTDGIVAKDGHEHVPEQNVFGQIVLGHGWLIDDPKVLLMLGRVSSPRDVQRIVAIGRWIPSTAVCKENLPIHS